MSGYKRRQPEHEAAERVDAQRAAGTCIANGAFAYNSQIFLRDAYQLALSQFERRVEDPECDALLILVNPESATAMQQGLTIGPMMTSLVVGRHSMATCQLAADSNASLRHALVLFSKSPGAGPLVRVLDLRSSTGIFTADDRMHHSVASNGPLALRAGDNALFVLFPEQFPGGDLLEFDAVEWTEVQQTTPTGSVEAEIGTRSRISNGLVTSAAAVSSVVYQSPPPQVTRHRGNLVFEFYKEDEKKTAVQIPHDQLVVGCLVGRYPRCHINGETLDFPYEVSRVHCLLIDIDDHIHIFDLASTNGVLFGDFPVEQLKLPERLPSIFTLCDDVRMTWHPL